ncbi:aldehyde dehydrogenase family protein [Thermomonospora cellulosilytica]|uniref:aldehyde dehydrogenase (NAD(+)) n=1 Tax=Thermomonospora cellulosilytica TaxID=1411118 RepID=A0A7W3N1Q8_9ACTN|nr:aldehyde dehydrogenase family protein [Thermomonospora cellulosilytica]MBA9005965.1 betaine-aldehyde dehydrogenase [Thermomonospora cellulosilytica]
MSSTPTLTYDHLYIGGTWTPATGGGRITVINPATEEPVGSCPAATSRDIDRAVHAARTAFDTGPWPRMTPAERAAALAPLARLYAELAPDYARLITAEMGSPAAFTAQTEHPRQIIDYYSDPGNLTPLNPEPRDGFTLTHEPAGVLAVITPWNMPHKTILMKVIPALVAGCTVIVKPAPQTTLDALALAEAFEHLNLPPGVLSVVPADNTVAEHLAAHPDVDKIAFTGSTRVGAHLARIAATSIRRISLELGGKSAMLLLPGADVTAAVATVPDASLANSGQICSNQTRILVHTSDYAQATRQLTDLLASLPVGDPTDPATVIGPLVTRHQRDQALRHIHAAHEDGARLEVGGLPLFRPGWYVAPTLFTDVHPASRLFQTEVFAPVLALTPYTTIEQAIEYANGTAYGLDGSVWGDPDRARQIAARLRTGTVRINGAPTGIHAPIGGFKRSGIGRELGPEGLLAFTETKITAA